MEGPNSRRKRTPLPDPEGLAWPSRSEAEHSLTFSPHRLGAISTRTRTWVPAMVPWRASDEGEVTPEVLEWYGRFADGQPGVLVVEATGIREVPSGPLLRIGDDRFVPGLRKLVDTVRERSGGNTRLLIQLIDFLTIRRRPDRTEYLNRFLAVGDHHRARVGLVGGSDAETRAALVELPHDRLLEVLSRREAEDLEFGFRERVDDEHLAHIADLPARLPALFADAAARAKDAGFDGVELHYAHAYTMASFLSRTNMRADGYGETPENRVRLPLEVLGAVRARVGDAFAVGCRFLGDEVIPGGSRIEDAMYYGERFAAAGMDFLSVSKGGKFDDAKQPKVGQAAYPYTGPSGHECMPTVFSPGGPFGRNLPLSAAIRKCIRAAGFDTPVVGCGGISTFELAENALRDEACDFVGAARQSLADPDWLRKVETGNGRDVRRCLFTNYCEALDQKHVEVTCQLWDRDFEQGNVRRTKDGKRRLDSPAWTEPRPQLD